MFATTSSKATESIRSQAAKTYEGITLDRALERLWELQHDYQELIGETPETISDRRAYELYVCTFIGCCCRGNTHSDSFKGASDLCAHGKQESCQYVQLTPFIFPQKDAQRVIEAAQRQDLAISVPPVLLSLFIELEEAQGANVQPRLSRVSAGDAHIRQSEWYTPDFTPLSSMNPEGSSSEALPHAKHKGDRERIAGAMAPLSKECVAVAFALDDGESEVEEDELIDDDDLPEEPQISRKGKPDRAGKLIIRLKPPSKAVTKRGRSAKKLRVGRDTPVPARSGEGAEAEEETTPTKQSKGKGKEVVRPARNTSKQVDRRRKHKDSEAEQAEGQRDDGERGDSGACKILCPDVWYLTRTRPSGPAEAHPQARDWPCEGRAVS